MKCRDIMNTNLEWLGESDTIEAAACKMAETGLGFLPICDNRMRPIGVVTDRDLAVRALAGRLDARTTTAGMVMSAPVLTCLASNDVKDAEELMAQQQKSRIAVTDAEGALVGVISLADLVERCSPSQAWRTVSAILWREALGARGGAPAWQPLLKDDPVARDQPLPPDDARARPTVFTGGEHGASTKEFP